MQFSIIIPVYNVEKYLPTCIKSLVSQNFTDYEVILIDDGSTDSSGRLCDIYVKQYENFQVIHQENQGQSIARNRGITQAKGEFLLFMDSDDYYLNKECLNRIYEKTPDSDVIVFNWAQQDELTFSMEKNCVGPLLKMNSKYICGEDFLCDILETMPDYPWYIFVYAIRRAFWEKNRFEFAPHKKYEDMEIIYRIIFVAKVVAVVQEVLYIYRKRAGSTVTSPQLAGLIDWLDHIEKNIAAVSNDPKYSKSLTEKLCNNFSVGYFIIMSKCDELAEEEQKVLFYKLQQAKWVGQYASIGTKQKIKKYLLYFGGIQSYCTLLKVWKKLKRKRARNEKNQCNSSGV